MDEMEQKLRDEVALWRNLIEGREWQGQGQEPVYPRMRDTLACAEQKLKAYLVECERRKSGGEILTGLDRMQIRVENRRRYRC